MNNNNNTPFPLLFAVIWFPVGLYQRSGSGELSERDYPMESASGESYMRQCGGGVASLVLVAGYMWFPIARRFELCRKRRVYKPLPEDDLINLEGLIGSVGYILKKAEQVLFIQNGKNPRTLRNGGKNYIIVLNTPMANIPDQFSIHT